LKLCKTKIEAFPNPYLKASHQIIPLKLAKSSDDKTLQFNLSSATSNQVRNPRVHYYSKRNLERMFPERLKVL
jgi:hypothetical protein